MSRDWNLKLFLSISLVGHALVFSIFSVFFPPTRISSLPAHPIEVTLLPLRVEKKEPLRNLKQRMEVQSTVGNGLPVPDRLEPGKPLPAGMHTEEKESLQTAERREAVIKDPSPVLIDEEIKPTRVKKVEVAFPTQKQEREGEPVSFPSLPSEAKDVSVRESLRSSSENNKGEMKGEMEEKVVIASLGQSIPQIRSPETPGAAAKNLSFDKNEIVFAQPRYAKNPQPFYPREARKKGYEGEVVLRVEVLSNGQVGEIEVRRSSGHEILDRSAMTAVKQWKFIPAKKDESPVPAWVNIPVTFQLR